ncbi:MAG: PEP/pyruvate-binding domain-containing protein [Alphaproteobacteria bacterium]
MGEETAEPGLVYLLDESHETCTPQLRGRKGAELGQLCALGLPVPPGLTITTRVARHAIMYEGAIPDALWPQLREAMGRLEARAGKTFGNPDNPLLVAVRSGAEVSMPGMMDTILNLGLTPEVAARLAERTNRQFAYDCYRRFLFMYGDLVCKLDHDLFANGSSDPETCQRYRQIILEKTGHPVPDDPWRQLETAVRVILESWNNSRARDYRRLNGIPDGLGTAINIQEMVYGNFDVDSGTGVVFSRDVSTGARGLYGEFLVCAQGEDVVAGTHTPLPVDGMKVWNHKVYQQLEESVALLERHHQAVVDVEFTVERGKLYLLQCRAAQTSPEAAATFAVHEVCQGRASRDRAVMMLTPKQRECLANRASLSKEAVLAAFSAGNAATGLPASPGVAVGVVAMSSEQAEALSREGQDVILVRHDTDPDDLHGMIVSKGVVTGTGGSTSHAAVVARDLGIPSVVGLAHDPAALTLFQRIREGDFLSLDGTQGHVILGRVPVQEPETTREIKLFQWWAGRQRHRSRKPALDAQWAMEQHGVNRILCDVYLTDAMASASLNSLLSRDAEDLRLETHHRTAKIYAAYLTLAVIVELNQSGAYGASLYAAPEAVDALFTTFKAFSGSEQAVPLLKRLADQPREQQITFLNLAAEVYNKGCFEPGFGGRLWGKIAETVQSFLSGQVSHTIFVDRVFDLQHHGRRMFDKHPMVANACTDEALLQQQLNNKRASVTIEELFTSVCRMAMDRGLVFGPSEPVLSLWSRGENEGLWGKRALRHPVPQWRDHPSDRRRSSPRVG